VIFLHPLALLGLAAAAIPALLHLLERRTPPEAEFPPLRYLRDAERQSARRLRLRHLLLLFLRTAVLALIVLAAARPIVPAGGGAGTVHAPTALAVVLDNSLSSGAVVDGRSVLERLKAVARASLEQAAPGDRLWLVLADGVARAGSREALLASLHAATATPQRLDLVSAVERAARVVAAEPVPAREVHVVSDLQRTALGAGRVDVRDVGVLVLAPPARVPANRGIAAARVTEGGLAIAVSGTPGAGAAPIVARLRLREAGRTLAAPGQSVTLPLPSLPPGWWVGEVLLDPDELRGDDARVFVARVAPPAGVAAGADVGPFVSAALSVLRAAKRVADGAEVSIGERPGGGAAKSIVLPPEDAALIGHVNRALVARGVRWHFGPPAPPGPITSSELGMIFGASVARRYRLEAGQGGREQDPAGGILATVNGEPWLVRDGDVVLLGSRLDTIWTALPAASGFVPFVDALVNRIARGQGPVAEAEGAPRAEFVTRGADTVGATVFGSDPRESDLTPAAPAELRRALPGARVLDETALAAERFTGTRRADVSGLLLALALLLAAVELAVASMSR
jgi:hypothetical protein